MVNIFLFFNVNKKLLKFYMVDSNWQKGDPILCNQQERLSYIPLPIQMKTEEML